MGKLTPVSCNSIPSARDVISSSFRRRSPAAADCENFERRLRFQTGRTQKEQKVFCGGREPRRDRRGEEEEDEDDVHGVPAGGAGEGV